MVCGRSERRQAIKRRREAARRKGLSEEQTHTYVPCTYLTVFGGVVPDAGTVSQVLS